MSSSSRVCLVTWIPRAARVTMNNLFYKIYIGDHKKTHSDGRNEHERVTLCRGI